MSERAEGLRIGSLQAGDLIFSTTDGLVSRAIRAGTGSKFSHASIYFRDGVILEANDDGVGPRRISPAAVDARGALVGLPYEDWSYCEILRHGGPQDPQSWEEAIGVAMRGQIGFDFPPLNRMALGAPRLMRLLARPIAGIVDVLDWLRNREPVAYDSWCSRLVGFVLTENFGHTLTAAQRKDILHASPQRLYTLAQELGYSKIEAWVPAGHLIDDASFRRLKSELLRRQDGTYEEWRRLAQGRRETIRNEHGLRLLRAGVKLVGLLAVLATVGLASALVAFRSDSRPWVTPGPVVLEELADADACAFRPIRDMGWHQGHKTAFCRFNGYGGGNRNFGAYKNGGVCIRGPSPEVCSNFITTGATGDKTCAPRGYETVCRRAGEADNAGPAVP